MNVARLHLSAPFVTSHFLTYLNALRVFGLSTSATVAKQLGSTV